MTTDIHDVEADSISLQDMAKEYLKQLAKTNELRIELNELSNKFNAQKKITGKIESSLADKILNKAIVIDESTVLMGSGVPTTAYIIQMDIVK